MNMYKHLKIGLVSLSVFTAIGSTTNIMAEQEKLAMQEAVTAKTCAFDKTTPIIPDGNVASEDELIAAQTRIKLYQSSLQDFRDCITSQIQELNPEAEDTPIRRAALLKRSNQSVEVEESVAQEFNEAIKVYKSR